MKARKVYEYLEGERKEGQRFRDPGQVDYPIGEDCEEDEELEEAFNVLKGPSEEDIEEAIKKYGRETLLLNYLEDLIDYRTFEYKKIDKKTYSYIANNKYWAFINRGSRSLVWNDPLIVKANEIEEAIEKAFENMYYINDNDLVVVIDPEGYSDEYSAVELFPEKNNYL